MDWEKAIEESVKGTATRIIEYGNDKNTIVKYKDGSGYNLVSNNGKVDFFLSRPAADFELNGFDDWQPS